MKSFAVLALAVTALALPTSSLVSGEKPLAKKATKNGRFINFYVPGEEGGEAETVATTKTKRFINFYVPGEEGAEAEVAADAKKKRFINFYVPGEEGAEAETASDC